MEKQEQQPPDDLENAKKSYKDPSGVSKIVIALLIIGALLNAVAAISSYREYELLVSANQGALITEEMANSNDARQGLIGIAQVVLIIITAVFFLTWVYRISWNGHYFSNSTQRHSPGWAVAYFFIPIVNLWRPYQALWDAHQAFIDRTADSKGNFIFQL